MFTKTQLTALLLTIAIPFGASALSRRDLLPTEASISIHITNTARFWKMLQHSSIGKLWNDDQFQDFAGNIDKEMILEALFKDELTQKDKILVEEYKMLSGELIVGMSPKEKKDYIIAELSEENFKKSLELDEIITNLDDTPYEIRQDIFQGHTLYQHIHNGGTPKETQVWQAFYKNTLLSGPSKEWVEKSLVELNTKEISEQEKATRLTIRLPVSQLIASNSTAKDMKLIKAIGLGSLRQTIIKVELMKNQMAIDTIVNITDINKGIFTLLDPSPTPLPSVTFIPDSFATIQVGRINLLRFWKEIPTILNEAMAESAPQYLMYLNLFKAQTGIDLEQDLLAHLNTRSFSFSVNSDYQQESIFALELNNAKAFKQGLETMFASPSIQPIIAAKLDTETFLDQTIYCSKAEVSAEDSFAFGVIDNHLLYGSPDAFRQVIRSQSSEAAENNDLEQSKLIKGIRQKVPKDAFAYGATDWKKGMETIMKIFNNESCEVVQKKWARSGSPIPPPNFNKLPPASHIASFFNTSYAYTKVQGNQITQKLILLY